jgi:hypothetical protein
LRHLLLSPSRISDPHFTRRERDLAKASLRRIEELENEATYHWTELARMALLTEVKQQVIGKQAATKIDSFLKRHRVKR